MLPQIGHFLHHFLPRWPQILETAKRERELLCYYSFFTDITERMRRAGGRESTGRLRQLYSELQAVIDCLAESVRVSRSFSFEWQPEP
jgi:hypothetical protein